MVWENVLAKFKELFGGEGEIGVYFAPGRVNMIGEHTDYNGGHVFPCALTIGTYGVARKRNDKKLRFYSMNFEQLGVLESSVENLKPEKEADWTNYPKGVMWAFGEKGMKVEQGMDLVLFGNIPNGSGLSSSASVEVLTGFILRDMFGFDVTNQDLALIGQYSENKFNGVNCGIMDQFAIAMGKAGHAIFLDTATLKYEYAPIKLENAKIVISCSNKKRGLGDSKYNERRSECEKALAELQKVVSIDALGDLTEVQFEEHKVLECDVYRYTGHYVGDPAKYMSVEYNTAAHQNDVIDKFKTYLLAEGVASQGELDAVEAAVEERMEKAYQFALDAPLPDPADVLKYNYACDNERSVAR